MYFEARAGRTAVLGASKVQREFGTHQINKNKNNPRQQPKKVRAENRSEKLSEGQVRGITVKTKLVEERYLGH